MNIEFYKAFTNNPEEGNPAGVIFDAENLSKEEMIKIAAKLNFSESVFVVKSNIADYRFRFMTKTTEVDACGHATIAGAAAIYQKNKFEKITIETNAGIVEVTFENGNFMMKTAKSELGNVIYNKNEISKLLNINSDYILDLPIITASVGSHKLMIPVKDLETIKNIKPDLDAMIEFCKNNPVKGFYPFTSQTIDLECDFHARQFNPAAGINEDPTTGIAAGALMLYLHKNKIINKNEIVIEQGSELKKAGKILVRKVSQDIFIGGQAVKFQYSL